MTAKIGLSQGRVALVDDDDVARVLAAAPWSASKCAGSFYARHWYRDQFGVARTISMHTLLTGWSMVDHVNGDGLDNRRSNLRPATVSQNNANSRRSAGNTSGFKGVNLYRNGRWRATLGLGGTTRHLGYFSTAEEAARAYDSAAIRFFGEYANLNFPTSEEKPA